MMRRYGDRPLHLLAHLAGLAIAAYALVQLLGQKHWVEFLAFFVGAALLHDVVLLPVYSAVDRLAHARWAARAGSGPRRVPIVNHLRAPALISALLLLIYLPLITGLSRRQYIAASGHAPSGYLRNWLLIVAALYAASAAAYAIRVWRR